MYETITNEEKQNSIILNILAREREIYQYQVNIDNYIVMLGSLPTEWPDNLLQYKGLTVEQIADTVAPGDIEVVSDLIFKDKLSKLLITERIEQSKATHIYNALIAQIDPLLLQSLLDAAVAGASQPA